jgi:hypothetical protein
MTMAGFLIWVMEVSIVPCLYGGVKHLAQGLFTESCLLQSLSSCHCYLLPCHTDDVSGLLGLIECLLYAKHMRIAQALL